MDLQTDKSNEASVSRKAISIALAAIVCVGIAVAIASTALKGFVATLMMCIALVVYCATRVMSERLDEYEISGGCRALIFKD